MTQLWRPPAAWVLPPSGSLPVTRGEQQGRAEWTQRINSSEPGQGQQPGGKPLFYGRSAPSQVRHSFTEGLHTWILSSLSPQELQSHDRKRGQGHRAAPTFNTTMIKSPLHFKSNKWRPLPARYPSALEASPPAEPKPPSGLSLYFLEINPPLQLK